MAPCHHFVFAFVDFEAKNAVKPSKKPSELEIESLNNSMRFSPPPVQSTRPRRALCGPFADPSTVMIAVLQMKSRKSVLAACDIGVAEEDAALGRFNFEDAAFDPELSLNHATSPRERRSMSLDKREHGHQDALELHQRLFVEDYVIRSPLECRLFQTGNQSPNRESRSRVFCAEAFSSAAAMNYVLDQGCAGRDKNRKCRECSLLGLWSLAFGLSSSVLCTWYCCLALSSLSWCFELAWPRWSQCSMRGTKD